MIELESTTDGTRLCVLTLDQKALSYPSTIWNVEWIKCALLSAAKEYPHSRSGKMFARITSTKLRNVKFVLRRKE